MPLVIPGLIAIGLFIADLIIIYALARIFGPMLRAIAGNVPLIGGVLGRAVGAIINDAQIDGNLIAEQEVRGGIGLITTPVYWTEHIMAALLNATNAAAGGIEMITGPLINAWLAATLVTARLWVTQAEQLAEAGLEQLTAVMAADFIQTYATIARTAASLENYSQQLFAAAESYTAAGLTAETEYVAAVAGALEGEIIAVETAAEAFTEASIAAETAFIEGEIAAVTAAEEAGDAAITGWVTGLLAGIQAQIALVESVCTEYAQQLTAQVQNELTTLEDDCVNNLCAGTSDLAKLLQDLEGALGLAGLIALAAEFAADPVGTAGSVNDTFTPVANTAAGIWRGLVGV